MTPQQQEEARQRSFRDAGLTPQQQSNVIAGIPSAPITGAALTPTPTPVVQPIQPPTVPDISKVPLAEIKDPSQADPIAGLEDIESRISGFDVEGGLKTRTAEQQRALNEINKRIGLHQARTESEAAKAEQMGETLGFARGEEALVRREAAVEAMELSALAQAAQGELLLAHDLAKDAVKTQFEELEKEARTKRANIIANYDSFTKEQKARADETLRKLDANDAFLKEEKERREKIQEIALDFVSKNGDLATAEMIRKTGDPVAAQALATKNLPVKRTAREVSRDEKHDSFTSGRQFITDNPDASFEELSAGLRENTDLTDGDISALLAEGGVIKQEASITGNEKALAVALVKSQGFGGEAQAAKDYLISGGEIEINGKTVKLTKQQVEGVISEIDKAYPKKKRGFFQSLLPGGK